MKLVRQLLLLVLPDVWGRRQEISVTVLVSKTNAWISRNSSIFLVLVPSVSLFHQPYHSANNINLTSNQDLMLTEPIVASFSVSPYIYNSFPYSEADTSTLAVVWFRLGCELLHDRINLYGLHNASQLQQWSSWSSLHFNDVGPFPTPLLIHYPGMLIIFNSVAPLLGFCSNFYQEYLYKYVPHLYRQEFIPKTYVVIGNTSPPKVLKLVYSLLWPLVLSFLPPCSYMLGHLSLMFIG